MVEQLILAKSDYRKQLRDKDEQLLRRQERIVELETACRGLHEDGTVRHALNHGCCMNCKHISPTQNQHKCQIRLRQLEDTIRVLSGRNELSDHYAAARADLQSAMVDVANAKSAATLAQEKESLARSSLETMKQKLEKANEENIVRAFPFSYAIVHFAH